MRGDDRGQVVLAAAGLVALALLAVLVAHLQLGYHADVRAGNGYDAPGENARRVLERAVHEAASGVPATFGWSQRQGAVDAVRDRLEPRLATLRTSQVSRGTAYAVSYNRTAASAWATERCPGGPDRKFGPCEADRGVVVQERVGDTHVLAVAVDLAVTTGRGEIALTLVVPTVGGSG